MQNQTQHSTYVTYGRSAEPETSSFRQMLRQVYNVDLPISGGWGDSIHEAIKIELLEASIAIDLQHQISALRYKMMGVAYKFVGSELFKKDGRIYDKMKYQLSHDPDNYYNIYYDVTEYQY